MAFRKNKTESTGESKKQSGSFLLMIVFISFLIVLAANCFSLYSRVQEKKEKYAALERLYQEELVLEQEYNYLLDDANRLEYIERIAREKYGYIAPGERAFYDSSYGN